MTRLITECTAILEKAEYRIKYDFFSKIAIYK